MEANSEDSAQVLNFSLSSATTSDFVTSIQGVDVLSTDSVQFDSASSSSTRIEKMMQAKRLYATALEFEIESSKDHWSELEPTNEAAQTHSEVKEFGGSGGALYTMFENHCSAPPEFGGFFYDYGDRLKVGSKIAEGAQAEIFEAELEYPNGNKVKYVLKIFKKGCSLQDLQKQWPHGILAGGVLTRKGNLLYDGTLLPDGRLAFRMQRSWGDLRKLIDIKMQQNSNQSMPFTKDEVYSIMLDIALSMRALHESKVVHRDLKASNVLVYPYWESEDLEFFNPLEHRFSCDVSDYEFTFGVLGTGFWRAPEVLFALKNGDVKSHVFTEKSDVYSYGMTGYEILTGCSPLEGVGRSDYDYVLRGGRPKFPETLNLPTLKVLINSCWHEDPSKRPSFQEIWDTLIVEAPPYVTTA